MSQYRCCVDTSQSTLLDVTTPYEHVAPLLDETLGAIARSSLFDELYVPMLTREYANEFSGVALWKRAPTDEREVGVLGAKRTLVGSLIRWAHDSVPQVVYLLAPIGTGKSTFLFNLLYRELPSVKGHELSPIVVDAVGLEDPSRFLPRLYDAVDEWIERSFPQFFHAANDDEIDTKVLRAKCSAFATAMRRDQIRSDASLEASLKLQREWLKKRKESDPLTFSKQLIDWARTAINGKQRIVLAVDNLDHYLSTFGDELLLRSHAAAESLGALLLLPLRDTSFRANNAAFVQAQYRAHSVNLVPAGAHQIIGRRLQRLKAQKIEDSVIGQFVRGLASRFGIDAGSQEEMFRTQVADLIVRWAEPLANRNRRQLLKILATVLASPHIVSNSFQRVYAHGNDYQIPKANIFIVKVKMALILGRYNYYNDDARDSVFVLNLFDTGAASVPWQNLFRLKLLQRLEGRRIDGENIGALVDLCQDILGEEYTSLVYDTLGRFVEVGLAAIINPGDSYDNTLVSHPVASNIAQYIDRSVFITANGRFHLTDLVLDDIYLDEMRFRSAMPDSVAAEVCRPFQGSRESLVTERVASTKAFLRYLQNAESDEMSIRMTKAFGVEQKSKDIYRKYENREMHLHQVILAGDSSR